MKQDSVIRCFRCSYLCRCREAPSSIGCYSHSQSGHHLWDRKQLNICNTVQNLTRSQDEDNVGSTLGSTAEHMKRTCCYGNFLFGRYQSKMNSTSAGVALCEPTELYNTLTQVDHIRVDL